MKWNFLKEKKPIATESGAWDGLRGTNILVEDSEGNFHVCSVYIGFMDGSDFCNFYDQYDYEIEEVVKWANIETSEEENYEYIDNIESSEYSPNAIKVLFSNKELFDNIKNKLQL